MAGDPFDQYLDDDEGGYGRFREDGWDHDDLATRAHLEDGRYRGPKDEQS